MTTGALLTVLFVGWKMKKSDVLDEFTKGGTLPVNGRLFPWFYFIIRFIAPAAIVVILVSGLLA